MCTDLDFLDREFSPPNHEVTAFSPGDIILTRSEGFLSRLISFGQRLRFHGKYSGWTHAAIIVSPAGDIIEAFHTGIEKNHISKYRTEAYCLIRVDKVAKGDDRRQMVRFADWCLLNQPRYGTLQVVAIALMLITGWRLYFGLDRRVICSSLVAKALERTEVIFERDSSFILPAELAARFKV